MKTIAILAAFLVATASAYSQSCCQLHTDASARFAALGSEQSFVDSHIAPEQFTYEAQQGSMITFATPDGNRGSAYEINPGKTKVLFVFQEWWGLNDYIKRESDKFAADLPDVTVMALDLYDGNVATDAKQASEFMQAVKKDRAIAIINGAMQHSGVKRIGTIGWCFGGGWSLQATLLAGTKAKACVMYYGMPETDTTRLRQLHAPIMGFYAENDGWINRKVISEFETKLNLLKAAYTHYWYKADHAFANPSNPKYDKDSATDAWKKAIAFLKQNL